MFEEATRVRDQLKALVTLAWGDPDAVAAMGE
jgi:hypothetical protein